MTTTARCSSCRKLFVTRVPIPASCPYCDSPSTVEPVAQITRKMLADHERAPEMR